MRAPQSPLLSARRPDALCFNRALQVEYLEFLEIMTTTLQRLAEERESDENAGKGEGQVRPGGRGPHVPGSARERRQLAILMSPGRRLGVAP